MKKALTSIFLAVLSMNVAADWTVGVVKTHHLDKLKAKYTTTKYDVDPRQSSKTWALKATIIDEVEYNEINPFVGYSFGKVSVGAFINSFGDVSPTAQVEIASKTVLGTKAALDIGAAYYVDNTLIDFTGREHKVDLQDYNGIVYEIWGHNTIYVYIEYCVPRYF